MEREIEGAEKKSGRGKIIDVAAAVHTKKSVAAVDTNYFQKKREEKKSAARAL